MANKDTIDLMKECDAGVKMAVESFDEVLEKVESPKLKQILTKSKEEHEKIGNRIHKELKQCHDEGKEPNPVAKAMSWMKTNFKMMTNPSDHEVADLIMDGCNMGIKSLCKYQNKYSAAEETACTFAKDLVDIESGLMVQLRPFL